MNDKTYHSWLLGDDYDCETCGASWNEAVLELWDETKNVWQLSYREGCYGGEGIMSDEPEWFQKTEEILATLETFTNFNENETTMLKKLLTEIKPSRTVNN